VFLYLIFWAVLELLTIVQLLVQFLFYKIHNFIKKCKSGPTYSCFVFHAIMVITSTCVVTIWRMSIIHLLGVHTRFERPTCLQWCVWSKQNKLK
jgi:hypothetical protein